MDTLNVPLNAASVPVKLLTVISLEPVLFPIKHWGKVTKVSYRTGQYDYS